MHKIKSLDLEEVIFYLIESNKSFWGQIDTDGITLRIVEPKEEHRSLLDIFFVFDDNNISWVHGNTIKLKEFLNIFPKYEPLEEDYQSEKTDSYSIYNKTTLRCLLFIIYIYLYKNSSDHEDLEINFFYATEEDGAITFAPLHSTDKDLSKINYCIYDHIVSSNKAEEENASMAHEIDAIFYEKLTDMWSTWQH